MKAIMVDDIDTDDSMKGINYDDIKSENSDKNQEEDQTDSGIT